MSQPRDWVAFVLAHGWRAKAYELAAVVGQDTQAVLHVRATGACKPLAKAKGFAELFSLWHGRAPEDDEWPAPRKQGSHGTYEWQGPEITLLAGLVGQMDVRAIARTLTSRLRERTGDPHAARTPVAVQGRINKIGLQTTDVLGGITVTEAAREIDSLAIVHQAIRNKALPARRVGRLWVIPHEAWKAWKAQRTFAPEGYVPLSSIRETLAIRSDKLSEFARMGFIPTAIQCNTYGTKGPSSRFGTWHVEKSVAEQLVADRQAGRPMPWHGMPLMDNLRTTFKLWKKRQHPACCETCAQIWGEEGPPASFEEYIKRYPGLAHGAKRHLTRQWDPGMTVREVAAHTGCPESRVRRAIATGMLPFQRVGRRRYVSRTEVTRWKARKCPSGDSQKSWVSLDTACKTYLFTRRELRELIDRGTLTTRVGTHGAMRGVTYVSKHQCRVLRETVGFTEEQAARRIGVTVERLRRLLEGVQWRQAEGIPLAAVQTAVKRLESRHGYTVEEAAEKLGVSVAWVLARKRDGTIKVTQAKWDRRRVYITEPMFQRLQRAKDRTGRRAHFDQDWLGLTEAAMEAGVCTATIIHWAEDGELPRRKSTVGWRYHREAVRARARRYWRTTRFLRATPPAWLISEQKGAA